MCNSYASIPRMKRTRRIATHEIVREEDNSVLTLSVVEILSGTVQRCYPLKGEQAATEWLPGRIVLRRDAEGVLRAYHNNIMIN